MSQSKQPEGITGHVGEFIRLQRERADISVRRLAERAGVSNPYLSQIERGLRKPSAEILKRISRGLSISAETLYSRAGLIEEGSDTPIVATAIAEDPMLTPRQKQVLLDLYRTLVSAGSLEEDATPQSRTNQTRTPISTTNRRSQ